MVVKKENQKLNNSKIITIALALLLVFAVIFITVDKIGDYKKAKENEIYKAGFDAGVYQANNYVFNQILTDINQNGQTSITVPTSQNDTVTIPLIPMTTIIGSVNQNGAFSFNTLDQNNETIQVDLILPAMCSQLEQAQAAQE